MKVALLSMDVEDWFHLDYFRELACARDRSLLDGVDVYREILAANQVPSTFFVLGELAAPCRGLLTELVREGHEIAAHGWDHARPLTMSPEEFASDLSRTRAALEDAAGRPVVGYRAPCFSLDRERLDRVRAAGFDYDSSRMPFAEHPLYGSIDLAGFSRVRPNVYRQGDFFEYELGVQPVVRRAVPVSGGAYVRIFPWALMGRLISSYLRRSELYIWYVHPFELSPQPAPPLPAAATLSSRLRFELGRSSVPRKLSRLIALLKERGFEFTTFAELRRRLLDGGGGPPEDV